MYIFIILLLFEIQRTTCVHMYIPSVHAPPLCIHDMSQRTRSLELATRFQFRFFKAVCRGHRARESWRTLISLS